MTGSAQRSWCKDAHRALEDAAVAGQGRGVPGSSVDRSLTDDDLVVFRPRTASAWLVRYELGADLELGVLPGVFDQVSVVVPERLADDAVQVCPSWMGVFVIGYAAGRAVLSVVREPVLQPADDVATLARLLWRDELATLLMSYGERVRPFAVRAELVDQLLSCHSCGDSRSMVLKYLLR